MRRDTPDAIVARRILYAGGLLLAGALAVATLARPEPAPFQVALATLPARLGAWHGYDQPPFAPAVLRELGVDAYLTRGYEDGKDAPISLYVGYYASQRQGDTIHSPLNCLPGAGWQPLSHVRRVVATHDAAGTARALAVNEYVVGKGPEVLLVLYWYQSHGRVTAGEYASRMLMVYDAIRLGRTDAALVRVVTPLASPDAASVSTGGQRAAAFVAALFPALGSVLPS